MLTPDQIPDLRRATARDQDGHRFGRVVEVFVDDDSDQVTWVTVSTGLFGTSHSFVPVKDADLADGDLVVPFGQNLVKNSPSVDAEDHLDADHEQRLYVHYGLA
ncbi:PRC-barrel domain-containing protein [Demetria terragena]|uniref:PRC-barrel domain-containing protein n=1 Tax=Demetria terragena TaxID=63959 RepID=UPI0003808EB7|nr:PRC-barrel domain-containing protein [Demetria terragena]